MNKLATISQSNQPLTEQLRHYSETKKANKTAANPGVKDAAALEKASSGFEALLLHQMLKSMWETVHSEGLLGENSNQSEIYRDMFNQAVADSVSEGRGIGVKEFLNKELIKQTPTSKL